MRFPFQINTGRTFDVAGFGTNAVDFLIEVPEYPAFNTKIELNRYTQAAGGEVATTMAGLERLGIKTTYLGRFGDDAAGKFGLESLKKEGVNVDHAEQVAGAATQTAFIVIDARNGERTVIWKRDEKLGYTKTDAPTSVVRNASVLHLTPHDVAAATVMARTANEAGTIVSVDIDNVFPGIDELLSRVDILIASAEFTSRLLGTNDHRKALPALAARFGCGVCGVTLGVNGSLLYSGGEFFETPAFGVPGVCRDTTGAGDAYRVGIIYGLLRRHTIADSARIANAVAALKCREVGARTALPTESELLEFLSSRAT
jgi:sugar/nucleoside kinase (ribokinase family)